MALKLIFMGTPDFSVPLLRVLVAGGHEIMACYTQPPRPAGRRGLETVKSPVHRAAEEFEIPVYHPETFKDDEDCQRFIDHQADAAIVVAYGLILPEVMLDAPRYGCLNMHASLLPRWRGAAPINRAIMAGDKETGVAVMRMEKGLDTGPVARSETVGISEAMTAGDLHDLLAVRGADLMAQALIAMERDDLEFQPQSDLGITYAHKIDKKETRIDWSGDARDVHNHIRGLSPFPGAWCEMMIGGKAQRVKILQTEVSEGSGEPGCSIDDQLTIACDEGAISIKLLQRSGKASMTADDFLRGTACPPGTQLL